MESLNNNSRVDSSWENAGSSVIQMGRYASKKNPRGPDIGSSENKGTFSWTLFLVIYLTAFTFFKTQMSAIVLWNFVWTLGGLMSWYDMTLGVFLFLVMIAGYDIAGRSKTLAGCIIFFGTMVLSVVIVGASFSDPTIAANFLNTAIATAGLAGLFILIVLAGRNH